MAQAIFYRFHCDYCGYNKVSESGEHAKQLVEYKRSPIQRTIPQYDPATKKVTSKNPIHLPKQFKCPGCGRLIRPRKINDVLKHHDEHKSERWMEDANNPNKFEGGQASPGGPEVPGNPPTSPQEGRSEI